MVAQKCSKRSPLQKPHQEQGAFTCRLQGQAQDSFWNSVSHRKAQHRQGSHNMQTDAQRRAPASSRAALGIQKSQKLSPQETGAGNACVIAEDHSTTEFAQKAVPTQPAGCHSNSDRYLENALLFCKSCVQGCLKTGWTLSSLQPTKCGACSSPATWIPPDSWHWAQTSPPLLDSFTLTSAEKLMSGLNCAVYLCRQSCTQLTQTSQDYLLNPEQLKCPF